jgi:protein O-GlcNAc transferase
MARDALLVYAYRLYESPQNPMPSGISLVNLVLPSLRPRSKEDIYKSQLLPLLSTLRSLHPHHLPTLLLLGCVHYSMGNYDISIGLNKEILAIDNGYVRFTISSQLLILSNVHQVEAMCNIGTTMKSIGRNKEAFEWWWKALQRRPTYWDSLVFHSFYVPYVQ